MSTLYELTGEMVELLSMLEDEEIDEEIIRDTLEGVEMELEDKADNYAKLIRNLESSVKVIKDETDRLNGRKKVFENRVKYLKNHLEDSMRLTGKKKFTTDLFSFGIQKNGGKRKLVIDAEIDAIPEEYRVKQPDIVNGDALRDYLKDNGYEGADGSLNCEWCHLEPQGESLRIR